VRALQVLRRRGEARCTRVEVELGHLLAEDASPPGLIRAAAHAQRALDAAGSDTRSLVSTPACSAGCSFCCHVHVDATRPEILAIAAHLASTRSAGEIEALRRRLATHVTRVDRLDDEARWAARIPCALLGDDGRCSVYPARPLRCRAFHSCSVDPCRDAFTGSAATEPLVSPTLARAHDAVEEGYERALTAAGLSTAAERLETGLLAALDDDGLP
jgi:Fe-S-cluster containining protein